MEAFISVSGTAVPLLLDDINTDQIAPADKSHGHNSDMKAMLFRRWKEGDPNFVFNRPQYQAPRILVAKDNFACGSSRESAVWCMAANGIRCVVARSIADIFKENCLRNGLLAIELPLDKAVLFEEKVTKTDGAAPFSVDLPSQTITCPDGTKIAFEIREAEKVALLEGLDDIGLTLKHKADIQAFEAKIKKDKPWLQKAVAHQ
jgi:3-isopropylmalate dehydratase small subunit